MSGSPSTGPGCRPAGEIAVVTGATGFLGSSLARRLLSRGVTVRVLARSPARARHLANAGAQVMIGEITDERAMASAVEGAGVVYHLAGRLLAPGVPAAEYRRTHVDGTTLLLRRARAEVSIRRLVHCSTTGVLGTTGEHPADEGAPMRPTNVYEATKVEAELAVRAASCEGVPAVIARPGLVYGPGDLHLLPFFRSVLGKRFRPIGRQAVWLHPIYIDDLVDGLSRCAEYPGAPGECFHLAGPQPVSLSELAQAIARAGGTRLPPGHIPIGVAHAAAAAGDRLPRSLRRRAPLTRTRLAFLTNSRMYDVTKARRQLGFAARTDLATGVALTVAWYRGQGYLGPGPRA